MVEVVKEVIKEVEVPGPERVVEVEKVVEDTTRIDQLTSDNKNLKKRIKELEEIVSKQPDVIEKIVEVEKTVEVPVEVEKAATGDLREAARLLAYIEFNKEDLTTDQIFEMIQKSSADEVKRKLGFWAVPLPKDDISNNDTNKQYIGKKR